MIQRWWDEPTMCGIAGGHLAADVRDQSEPSSVPVPIGLDDYSPQFTRQVRDDTGQRATTRYRVKYLAAKLRIDTRFDLRRPLTLAYGTEWLSTFRAARLGQSSNLSVSYPSVVRAIQATVRFIWR